MDTRAPVTASITAILLACPQPSHATNRTPSIRLDTPFVIAQAEFPRTAHRGGWGLATHPLLAPLGAGRIALTYFTAGDGVTAGTASLPWPAYSDDLGRTWAFGDPFQWCNGPPEGLLTELERGETFKNHRVGIFNPSVAFPDGSRILMSWVSSAGPRKHHSLEALRTDDGSCWSGRSSIPFLYEDRTNKPYQVAAEGAATVLEDGRVLIAGWVRYHPKTDPKMAAHLYESMDGGANFRFKSVIADGRDAPWGEEGPNESAMVFVPEDDSLLCILRVGSGKPFLYARSADQGITWSREEMEMRGVMPKLLRLDCGAIALAYGRPGNHLALSADGGRSWTAPIDVTPKGQATSGYIDICEVEPDRLLVVYDHRYAGEQGDGGDIRTNRIMGVFATIEPPSPAP